MKEKQPLCVTVTGSAGSGKSAVLSVIHEALERAGIVNVVLDPGVEQEITDKRRMNLVLQQHPPTVLLIEHTVYPPTHRRAITLNDIVGEQRAKTRQLLRDRSIACGRLPTV